MFLIGIAFVIISFLVFVRLVTFTHWSRHGIPYLVPSLPFGNLADTMLRKSSFGQNISDLYAKTSAPLIGLYLLWRPAILLREPALVKQVLGVDFAYFHDRGIYTRPEADPISDSIFAMTGHRWRKLRSQLTPMFTAGRMKNMLPTVYEKADHLVEFLAPMAEGSETIEIKDYTSRYVVLMNIKWTESEVIAQETINQYMYTYTKKIFKSCIWCNRTKLFSNTITSNKNFV